MNRFGLLLSVGICSLFLKAGQSWRTTASTTLIAVVVTPGDGAGRVDRL